MCVVKTGRYLINESSMWVTTLQHLDSFNGKVYGDIKLLTTISAVKVHSQLCFLPHSNLLNLLINLSTFFLKKTAQIGVLL